MKKLLITLLLFCFSTALYAENDCQMRPDILIIGDSQVGATWAKSYVGNFLTTCLKGDFVIYGRGATIPANWMGKGGMDHIETIQRDRLNEHLNIGSKLMVPDCKKRLEPMLQTHQPKKLVLSFGGNYGNNADQLILKDMQDLKQILLVSKVTRENCFFVTPTYEMEVKDRRNVPGRNLQNTQHVTNLIKQALDKNCQVISGLDIMKNSPYFDGNQLLIRQAVEGRTGCMGAAVNDNVHICGAAAQDYAQKLCDTLN